MKGAGRGDGIEGARIELQLDTAQILLVIAALLGLCATAFYLGRWVERDTRETTVERTAIGAKKITDSDAGSDLTFFDTLTSSKAEPSRQVGSPSHVPSQHQPGKVAEDSADGPVGGSATASTAPPHPASPPQGAESGFALQVFAGDRSQAEKIAASLSHKGYATRVLPGTGGTRTARVRVVGYKTRSEAERGADKLKKEEKLAPWVVKAE